LPIVLQDRPVAVLAVESPTAEALPADDIMLLRLLVEWLARAVENAGLFQAVADERHRLKALVASSEDGILLLTPQTEIAVINPRAVELLALPESWETWVNRPFSDALLALRAPLPDGFRQKVKQAISDIISQTYASQQGALQLQGRHLRWNTIPVQSGPEQVGWLLVIKDESQRHEMEQFRQDLTRTMVHDLRNPLSGILNSLEFVEMLDEMNEAPLQARQRKYLTRAEQNARGLLQLVNEILEAYRLESGHVVPRLEQANMAQLIDETCTAQRSIADGKQIELRRRIPADLPLVEADPQLLRRVLQNLLDNAIKFSPRHSVVTVTAAIATFGERQVVRVSVADQGPGIPIELRTRLFDRFTTGGHEASGSGLGLAFCKQAVNAQQGRIWLETPQEGGSMFTFVLPTVSEAGDE
jgi:signal transduction histidine kinase